MVNVIAECRHGGPLWGATVRSTLITACNAREALIPPPRGDCSSGFSCGLSPRDPSGTPLRKFSSRASLRRSSSLAPPPPMVPHHQNAPALPFRVPLVPCSQCAFSAANFVATTKSCKKSPWMPKSPSRYRIAQRALARMDGMDGARVCDTSLVFLHDMDAPRHMLCVLTTY